MAAGRSVGNHGKNADKFVWRYQELIIVMIQLKGSYLRL